MTKIRITTRTADDEVYGNALVTVKLVDAGSGAALAGGLAVAPQSVKTDGTTGIAIIDLTPSADVTPAGTFYAFTVNQTSPTVVRYLEVPAANGAGLSEVPFDWDDPDLERLLPVPPTSIPAASQGDADDVVTVVDDGDGKRFVLAPAPAGVGAALLVGGNTFTGNQVIRAAIPIHTFQQIFDGAEVTVLSSVTTASGDFQSGTVAGRADLSAVGGPTDIMFTAYVTAAEGGYLTISSTMVGSPDQAPRATTVLIPDLKMINFLDPSRTTLGVFQSAEPVLDQDVTTKAWTEGWTEDRIQVWYDVNIVQRLRAGYTAASLVADPVAEPTLWVECGADDGDGQAWWACPTVIPSPSDTMTIRALARWRNTFLDAPYNEMYSECLDGGEGAFDRFELAFWRTDYRLWLFYEWSEIGATHEQWLAKQGDDFVFDPDLAAAAPGIPTSTWVEVRVDLDLTTGNCNLRVRTDGVPDWVDPDDGSLWMTVREYETGAASSLEASSYTEQWIGRGAGSFDVGRVRRWDDGVLVMDFNPTATASAGDTAVADSVLLDDADDPAIWTATAVVSVVTNPRTEALADVAAATTVAELAEATAAYLGMS